MDDNYTTLSAGLLPNKSVRADKDEQAFEDLVGVIYDELKPVARSLRFSMRPGEMLQTTEIVHDAIVRVAEREGQDWESQMHLKAFLARVMRNLIVDHLRYKTAAKRVKPDLDEYPVSIKKSEQHPGADLIDLDKALQNLAGWAPRQARIVECRFFGGMTVKETSSVLNLSMRTVEREWTKARAHLSHSLSNSAADYNFV